MSTYAIDSARTSARLSAFMSKVSETSPVDQIFVELPLWEKLWADKVVFDGGRQEIAPVDTQANTTIQSFSDYDVFNTTPQNSERTIGYAYVNYGGTVSISWEEMREVAKSDERIFDRLQSIRDNAVSSLKDRLNSDLFVSAPASTELLSLPFLVNTTGTVGGIDSSLAANAYWRSNVTTGVGAFTTNGLNAMRTMWNNLRRIGKGEPTFTLTTQTIYESYENELDVDVRYSDPTKLNRGASTLTFHGKPFFFDADCPSGEMYMLNMKYLKLKVDSDGQFTFDEFQKPYDQKAFVSTFAFRGQVIMTQRRVHGKMTGIS